MLFGKFSYCDNASVICSLQSSVRVISDHIIQLEHFIGNVLQTCVWPLWTAKRNMFVDPMISPWYPVQCCKITPHHRWLRFHVLAMRRQGSGAGGGDVSGGRQDCHRNTQKWDLIYWMRQAVLWNHWILDLASLASHIWVKNMGEVGGSSQFTYVALTPSTVGQRHQSIRGCVVKSVAVGCRFMSSPIACDIRLSFWVVSAGWILEGTSVQWCDA